MKLLTLLFIMAISSPVFSKEDDGGWSSSGGGEYITTQNNPWFMGTETVKWCIDHGGAKNFSLPMEKAKIEIERGIKVVIDQLRRANDSSADVFFSLNEVYFGNCGVRQDELVWRADCSSNWQDAEDQRADLALKKISDNYSYTSNCKEADLTFILGNRKSPLVKKLIKKVGKEKVRRLVGTAIRTSYDTNSLRGKGFIYIAADKGRLSYKGDKNQVFKSPVIWNIKKHLPSAMSVPSDFIENNLGLKEEILVDKYMIQPLEAVVTHEVAHVLGFKHQLNGLMGEDFPAKVVTNGLISRFSFDKISRIIGDTLYDSSFKTLSFDLGVDKLGWQEEGQLRRSSPAIYNMISPEGPENFHLVKAISFDFIEFPDCDSNDVSDECKHIGSLNLFKIEGRKFVKEHSYKAKFDQLCGIPKTFDLVTLRIKNRVTETIQVYNEETRAWERREVERDVLVTNKIMNLWSKKYCGYITNEGKKIGFEFLKNYNSNITLKFKDYDSGYELNLSSNNEFRVNYDKFGPGVPKVILKDF